MNNKNILCIHHGHCMDGFTAAWVVRKALGPDIEFYAATHGDPPPDVTGKNVIIVDFSYKRTVLLEMAKKAVSMLVLDHHKSAAEDLVDAFPVRRVENFSTPLTWDRHIEWSAEDEREDTIGNGCAIHTLFDMERSGAGIAWDFFIGGDRESFINHVEDRDLWRFQYADTRNICASVFSYPYDFEVWDRFPVALRELAIEGAAIERKHHKDIAEIIEKAERMMTFTGSVLDAVPVVNVPYTMGSDAAHALCMKYSITMHADERADFFAAYYWDSEGYRNFGLRSLPDGADVSEIAKMYGGGGHKHAAGFRVPFGHELTK
jgi:uncharacterized protein